MQFVVIGITDNPRPSFSPEALECIVKGKVFSGGRRHHDIVQALLPQGARWIDIAVPLDAVFEQYKSAGTDIVVFASGDPLFFGFANPLRRKMPEAKIVLYPSFNSLQMLAHRLLLAYHDMQMWKLQASLDRNTAGAEADVPQHVLLRETERLERQQPDGHLGYHLLSAVEQGELVVGYAE